MANLRKLAKGQECQVRIPGVCNFNNETTVLHHIKMPGITGVGVKSHDLLGAWCCSSCHGAVHGIMATSFSKPEIRVMELEGVVRTQVDLIEKGVVKW